MFKKLLMPLVFFVSAAILFGCGFAAGFSSAEVQAAPPTINFPSLAVESPINPLKSFDCDSPTLRLWIYDHFTDVKFDYGWVPIVDSIMCNYKCGVPMPKRGED